MSLTWFQTLKDRFSCNETHIEGRPHSHLVNRVSLAPDHMKHLIKGVS